jgi:hypothetical protein
MINPADYLAFAFMHRPCQPLHLKTVGQRIDALTFAQARARGRLNKKTNDRFRIMKKKGRGKIPGLSLNFRL